MMTIARIYNFKGYTVDIFGGLPFFCFCEIKFCCFVVAIFDLVHDVEIIYGLCELLTAYGYL